MKTLTAVLLAALAVDASAAAAPLTRPSSDERPSAVRPAAVYGEDSRVELREAPSSAREQGGSVAAVLFERDLERTVNGYRMRARASYGATPRDEGPRACPGERFEDQPNWSNCTASLVAPDVMLTAGHCISESSCERTRFVFGYALGENGFAPAEYPADAVYACGSIMAKGSGSDDDWALVRLDRKAGRAPLKVSLREVRMGQELYMIGHPAGLPAKYTDDAVVVKVREGGMVYEADLDAYGGNSGSPVFGKDSGRIVGVLVAGENDYEAKGECWSSERYRQFFRRRGLGGLAERVTAVNAFAEPLVVMALNAGTARAPERTGPRRGPR